jgi:myo-inositol-hexaphosphate 3-phosphohydrolase
MDRNEEKKEREMLISPFQLHFVNDGEMFSVDWKGDLQKKGKKKPILFKTSRNNERNQLYFAQL